MKIEVENLVLTVCHNQIEIHTPFGVFNARSNLIYVLSLISEEVSDPIH
jgi:hypothetical protein